MSNYIQEKQNELMRDQIVIDRENYSITGVKHSRIKNRATSQEQVDGSEVSKNMARDIESNEKSRGNGRTAKNERSNSNPQKGEISRRRTDAYESRVKFKEKDKDREREKDKDKQEKTKAIENDKDKSDPEQVKDKKEHKDTTQKKEKNKSKLDELKNVLKNPDNILLNTGSKEKKRKNSEEIELKNKQKPKDKNQDKDKKNINNLK